MKEYGFEIETVNVTDFMAVLTEHGIPADYYTCHVAVIGDYFVAGHMPIKATARLLEEKPAIDGIVLPGMPDGSPGMPGTKTWPFVIYAISNGEVSEFMMIP